MGQRCRGRFIFATLLWGVASCSSGDAGKSTPPGSSAQNPAPWAANAGEVTRFSDEVPFGPPATIAHDQTVVRKSPGGATVSTLPAGTDVVKLATHGSDDLVCFDDPTAGRHLMGWVAQADLDDFPPPAPPPAPDPVVDDGAAPPSPPDPPAPHGGGHHHRPRKQRR